MKLYLNQRTFILETLTAIYLDKSKIGKKHYSATVTKEELKYIIDKLSTDINIKNEVE